MCGIAGILLSDPQAVVQRDLLVRMMDTLVHRGPDDAGIFQEGPIGLAHRRLSIVDPAGGHQPMQDPENGAWIAYNGEVYNHPSLKRALEGRGVRYATRCDTETILHLYRSRGERCVECLRGMFAFAIWDGARHRLMLARDRLGIKPLYYAFTGDALVFASEMKAILATGLVTPELNLSVIPEYLATRFVSGEETFFSGIRKLLPGRTLLWSPPGGIQQRRYWRLPHVETPQAGPEETAVEVRGRLEDALRCHLMSDVPLGLFLSGGIDSSGLAALMAPMVSEPIRTFSVGFDDPAANELHYARLAAAAIGSEHHEVVVTPEEFWRELPHLVWHEDEPIAFTSSVPLYFLSRLAREHVKVVLTGEGADELFLGYNRYRVTAWNERLDRYVPSQVRPSLMALASGMGERARRYAARSFLQNPSGPRGLFCENFAVFTAAMQDRLLADPALLAGRDPHAVALQCWADAPGGTLERMAHADMQTYLVELLMKQDQMSMAASIESRVPFLDNEFVDYVAALPGRLKLRGCRTKAVLRAALRDVVPRPILTRRKMGFPVPVGRWLAGPFSSIVDEFVLGPRAAARGIFSQAALRSLVLEHREGAADHGERLWLLVNLEIWQRIFLDREDPIAVKEAFHV